MSNFRKKPVVIEARQLADDLLSTLTQPAEIQAAREEAAGMAVIRILGAREGRQVGIYVGTGGSSPTVLVSLDDRRLAARMAERLGLREVTSASDGIRRPSVLSWEGTVAAAPVRLMAGPLTTD